MLGVLSGTTIGSGVGMLSEGGIKLGTFNAFNEGACIPKFGILTSTTFGLIEASTLIATIGSCA